MGLIGFVSWFVRRLVDRFVGLVARLVVVCLCISFIFNISDIARVIIDVIVDHLTTTIRKDDGIRALGVVSITALLMAKIIVVVVFYGIIEAIVSRRSLSIKSNRPIILPWALNVKKYIA